MGMEFRPYYFAKEWVSHGHTVTIVSADYSHLRRKNPIIKHDFQKDNIDGITYVWIKTVKYKKNGIKRAVSVAQFLTKLWIKAKQITKTYQPDVVIASSTYPLDTYIGQKIARISRGKTKLIHEVHDMWPISPIEIGGMSPKNPFIRILQRGEDSFCKNSDAVVSLLPATKDYFMKHGMSENKFYHIPNGVVLEEWETPKPLPDHIQKQIVDDRSDGRYILCFFGSINKTYNLEILIAAGKCMRDNEIAIYFIGDGNDKMELMNTAKGYEDRFRFFDPIPKNTIPSLFNYIDASFVGAKSKKIFRFGIAMNKLFDSMMGMKPILYMVDAPNDYISQFECGVIVEGDNVEALMNSMKKLIHLSPDEQVMMGKRGRKAAVEIFNYESLSQRFIAVMNEITRE